jgi:hypothetical protein
MDDWKGLLIAGAGGGILYTVLDKVLASFLRGYALGAGVTLEDVLFAIAGKYGADKVASYEAKAALNGLAVIAVYRIVNGLLGGVISGATASAGTPSPYAQALAYAGGD